MTADTAGDGLAAALIQLSAHAERISGLDNRETGHHQDITAQLGDLTATVASVRTRVDSIGDEVSQQSTATAVLTAWRTRSPRSPGALRASASPTGTAAGVTSRSLRRAGGSSPARTGKPRWTG